MKSKKRTRLKVLVGSTNRTRNIIARRLICLVETGERYPALVQRQFIVGIRQ